MDIWRSIDKVLEELKKSPIKILMLDFDGTLSPIADSPKQSKLSHKNKTLLTKISKKRNIYIVIISGRSLKDIKKKVGLKNITYAGNHGLEGDVLGEEYLYPVPKKIYTTIKEIYKKLKNINNEFPGSLIENKKLSLSFHYRNVEHKSTNQFKLKVNNLLRPFIKDKLIYVLPDKKVFDIFPNVKCNKGTFARLILNKIHKKTNTKPAVMYIGDDITDEIAFKALKDQITIKVGKAKTKAKYKITNTKDVAEFLRQIYIML